MLIIDRFEDNLAIIENDNTTFSIPKSALPKKAQEGDVIEVIINQVATQKRTKEIQKLANELFE